MSYLLLQHVMIPQNCHRRRYSDEQTKVKNSRGAELHISLQGRGLTLHNG